MAGKKRKTAGDSAPAVVADTPDASDDPALPILPETEPVKVNNASLREIKDALDDALRRMLTRPDQFKQNHTHTDVRLALGWSAVVVAGATGLYGWKFEFEESKFVVMVGVALYVLFSVLQYLYQWFVEKDIVFVGKRRSVAGRIETEHLTLSSKLNPKPRTNPIYVLTASYKRTTNGGKTLLHSTSPRPVAESPVARWFDKEGNLDVQGFERWVGELVGGAMGVMT